MNCSVKGCKNPRASLGNGVFSIKCAKHKDLCPHCLERVGDGDWNMGYCQECQPKLVSSTIVLPLEIPDDTLTKQEIAMMMSGIDDS